MLEEKGYLKGKQIHTMKPMNELTFLLSSAIWISPFKARQTEESSAKMLPTTQSTVSIRTVFGSLSRWRRWPNWGFRLILDAGDLDDRLFKVEIRPKDLRARRRTLTFTQSVPSSVSNEIRCERIPAPPVETHTVACCYEISSWKTLKGEKCSV